MSNKLIFLIYAVTLTHFQTAIIIVGWRLQLLLLLLLQLQLQFLLQLLL